MVVFTDPEIARIGLTEHEAKQRIDEVAVTHQPVELNDRSRTEGLDTGFVKVVTRWNADKILGATIVAPNAGDLIQNFVSAMARDDGLSSFSTQIFPYPTITESIGQAARNWRQGEISPSLMSLSRMALRWIR